MDAESKERGRDYLAAHVFLTTARLGRARGNRPATQGNGAAREEVSCARNGALACKESGRSVDRLVSLPLDNTLFTRWADPRRAATEVP